MAFYTALTWISPQDSRTRTAWRFTRGTFSNGVLRFKEARDRLKITIASDPDLAKLADRIDEAKFHRRDLGEILSHHLVAYHQDTGRDVIRDMESRNRKIEFKAKLGKPALDQPRLPLGINRHLGQHFPIPVGMKVEVKPEEGE